MVLKEGQWFGELIVLGLIVLGVDFWILLAIIDGITFRDSSMVEHSAVNR